MLMLIRCLQPHFIVNLAIIIAAGDIVGAAAVVGILFLLFGWKRIEESVRYAINTHPKTHVF